MTRRAQIVIISAAALLTLFVLVVGGIVAATETAYGRAQIRRLVVSMLRGRINGSVYVGNITDGFFRGLTIDSLAIRDAEDSLFVSTGPVTIHYDVRDLMDRRLLLQNIRAEHPVVYIRQHENGDWNFKQIFRSKTKSPIKGGPGFGDYVVLDSVALNNATFWLTLPWHPSHTLRGAARDSAIKFELGREDHEVRRVKQDGKNAFARTWRWTNANALLVHARLRHPDTAGMSFTFSNVSVTEADPPFRFSNVHGNVKQLGDSVWINVPHFDLPASTGRASGKIVWGSNLPVRYAIHVTGDSVSMADVAWVYPTLPTTGGGKTDLDIITDPKNLHLTNFVLSNMDVRSTRSHLLGGMTFTTGQDTLIVKDVRLTASPVNFDLLRTLNGKDFPYDWQGNITGTVRASGGNLARFKVEDAKVTFADANVPGAITRATARGELDIMFPAFTAFHGFDVDVQSLDLRTLQFLNEEFPRVNGTIAGTVTLDSSWLDVRFRNANLIHHDAPGPDSHVTGNGRITWGEKYLTYDLDLIADSLSLTTLAQSYPKLPVRGLFAGPIRVQGESPDLRVTAQLSGDAGSLTYDGRVDADPTVYGAHGSGTIAAGDLQKLLDTPSIPHTVVNGTYTVDFSGDTLPNLVGTVSVTLDTSVVGTTRLTSTKAYARFADGLVHIDTATVQTAAGKVDAHGSMALAAEQTGTLHYTATIQSIPELGRLLGQPVAERMSGTGRVTGTLTGTPSTFAIDGALDLNRLSYSTVEIGHATGSYSLSDVTHSPSGMISIVADSVAGGPVPLDTVAATIHLASAHEATFQARVKGKGDVEGNTAGNVSMIDGLATIQVDTARLSLDSANTYRLSGPARVTADSTGVSVDSVMFARERGGAVAIRDVRMTEDSIRGSLRTSGFSLAFLELFGPAVTGLSGALTASIDVSGLREHPRLAGAITVQDGTAFVTEAGARFEHLEADIALDGDTIRVRRLSAETDKERRGKLNASGTIALDRYDNPSFSLEASAENLRAVDRRGLASLDISTSTPITLTGSYKGAVLRGGIRVDRGTIYIPELINKRIESLSDPEIQDVIDTTLAENRDLLPQAPSELMRNLRLQNVSVNIGDDVWLRSAEANIKLGGSLNVTLGSAASSGGVSQLALEGELTASRGTYRLNIVPLVQPVFDVESGTLRFYGTPNLNPTLHITAINTVRKPQQSVNRQDVRIRATIAGTLSSPTLTLSSADNLPLTQSDLLSYLITGEPAFALDYTAQQYVNQIAAAVIRSVGSGISSAIPRSVFDVVELQTPGTINETNAQAQADNPALFNLLNTRAVLGKQLNSNLFLNFSTGFCAVNFRENIGLRLEYRFSRLYTALLGLEPGSSDLGCTRTSAAASIRQTPPQFGVDIFRAWRF